MPICLYVISNTYAGNMVGTELLSALVDAALRHFTQIVSAGQD